MQGRSEEGAAMRFSLLNVDGNARVGTLQMGAWTLPTPMFMPVATQGTVKAMTPLVLREVGADIILCNTYHLYLRPGHDVVAAAGGLRGFTSWDGPVLTDSGGFQVYSLSPLRKIKEDGVQFKSHIDGSTHFIGPIEAMQIQRALGADIVMAFDECPPYPATYEYVLSSLRLTTRWARQCKEAHDGRQLLFGIIQGGEYEDLRRQSAAELKALDFDGYALGGVSVGEPKDMMYDIVSYMAPEMPQDKPRYLMGVGFPQDILHAVEAGFDMFDCVIPTRTARHGTLLTHSGRISIKAQRYKTDTTPLDPLCQCYTCKNFSRSYLNHLFRAKEILSITLNTIHNLHFYFELMSDIRSAITQGRFKDFKAQWLKDYGVVP